MKRIFTTFVIASIITATNAQEQISTEVKSITTSIVTVNDSVVAKDSTIVYNNFLSRTNGLWNLNLLSISTDQKGFDKKKTKGHSTHYADLGLKGISLAYSGLSNTSGLDQKVAHSLELGLVLGKIQHWNASRTFGLQSNIGLSWNRYSLEGKQVIQVIDGETVCNENYQTPNGRDFSRNRLTYVSWRVPVLLQFQDRRHVNCFSIGVEGELRHHVRSRIRLGKEKQFDVERHNIAVNPWGLNAIARYDIEDFGIFARCAVTPLFDSKKTQLEATPFAVGFVLHFD